MSAKTTTICGNCECEWDADLKAPDSECPECGYVDGDMGENVMRLVDRAESDVYVTDRERRLARVVRLALQKNHAADKDQG